MKPRKPKLPPDPLAPKIADENHKLGRIPNISTIPGADCVPGVPCAKIAQCYAMGIFARRPNVRQAWRHNSELAHRDPMAFFRGIAAYLEKKQPSYFRWHVSGDILNQAYLEQMKQIADENPKTRFLAFTKRYELNFDSLPRNLAIVFSAWPGKPLPAKLPFRVRVAWLRNPKQPDSRIPKNALDCPGLCETCGMCWQLWKIRKDVAFNKHR